MTRLVAVHFWPAKPIADVAITLAAAPTSASGSTIEAFSPPISHCAGMPRAVAACATCRPTAVEPVKEMTSAWAITAPAVVLPPGVTCSRPSGRCGESTSARRSATATASLDGLRTTPLP